MAPATCHKCRLRNSEIVPSIPPQSCSTRIACANHFPISRRRGAPTHIVVAPGCDVRFQACASLHWRLEHNMFPTIACNGSPELPTKHLFEPFQQVHRELNTQYKVYAMVATLQMLAVKINKFFCIYTMQLLLSRIRETCLCDHLPPRLVGTPQCVNGHRG